MTIEVRQRTGTQESENKGGGGWVGGVVLGSNVRLR